MADSNLEKPKKDFKIDASFVVSNGHLIASNWACTEKNKIIGSSANVSIDEHHQIGLLWLITGWKSGRELHINHDAEVTKLYETLRHEPEWLKPLFGTWLDLSSAIGSSKTKCKDFWRLSRVEVSFGFIQDGFPESIEKFFEWLDSKYLGENHTYVKLEYLSRRRFGLGAGFTPQKTQLTGKAYALTIAKTLSRLLDVNMLGTLQLMIQELGKEGDWEPSRVSETCAEVRLISNLVKTTDGRIFEILDFSKEHFEKIFGRFEFELLAIVQELEEIEPPTDKNAKAARPLKKTTKTSALRSLKRIKSDLESEIVKLTDKIERCTSAYQDMLRSV